MKRFAHAAEAIVLVAVVAAPWPYGSAVDPARYALSAGLLLAVGLWAASRAADGQGLPRLGAPIAGLLGLALAQALTGSSAAPVWTAEAFVVLAAMLGVLLFWSERARDNAAATRAAGAVLLACAGQAIFGAAQWSLAPARVYGQTSPIVTTPFGSYVNHNHFAGLVGMGVVLSAALALGYTRRAGGLSPQAVGFGGLTLALAAAHLASRSRGGLLALIAGLGVLAVLWASRTSRHPGTRGRLAWGAAGAAALLAFALVVVPASTRSHLATVLHGPSDSSGQYRVEIARATVRLAASHPLVGSGIGAYADALPPFKRGHGEVRTTHAESDWIEFAAEGGLIGLTLVLWLALGVVRGFRPRLRHGRDPVRKALAVGAFSAAAALAVHSAVDFNLRLPANALVFATLVGVAAAPREASRPWGGRGLPGCAAVLCFALSLAAAWRAWGALALDRAPGASVDRRISALEATIRQHPYLAEAWRARGLAWRELGWGRSGRIAARLEWAQSDLERAVQLRPRWAEAWADIAWTRQARGDGAGARQAMDHAIHLDPTHVGIRRAHDQLVAARNLAPATP